MNRVLILTSEFPPGPGGIGTHAYQISNILSENGVKVWVLSPQDYCQDSEIVAFNETQQFKITTLSSHQNKGFQSAKRLKVFIRTIKEFQPDLIIASGLKAIWLTSFSSALHKTPWVIIGHGTEFGKSSGIGAKITKSSANKADAIICVSNFTKKVVMDLGVHKPTYYVIHNGADHKRYNPLPNDTVQTFRRSELVEDSFVLLTVGNVSDRKGQEIVIRALPKIIQSRPDVKYWMAGLPQKKPELLKLATQLDVGHAIRFWGRVDDMLLQNLYNACDLFIMTSRQLSNGDFEGFGIAVIEAALCGKPAIVSNNSGLAEAVNDGVTGILIPQNNPDAAAEAILSFAESPQKIQKLGQQAYHHAITHQTWHCVGEKYINVFQNIISDRKVMSS